ncbi:FMN-binding protein [Micromonospora radicis]|uniref:FMN-binding protein n=1 Tax=Micromonospora radicis TaxID=1894971 RepID=A0A418MUA4_9ACTN|nr:FMN-binding protein [Micromonospora radicis]RIV37972.1 FMN-binding protein [Micromonospora radicis]
MRRALVAITGLAASTTALVVLKAAPGTSQVAQDVPAGQPPAATGAAEDEETSPDATAAPATGKPKATKSARPQGSASATPSRTASGGATRTPSAPRTTTAAPQPTARTVTGPVVSNEFGNVQVQITVSGSRIVNAVALELPEKTAQSVQRSGEVDSRYSGTGGMVVARQGADLDTVSGATATSRSYQQSLQAAIDRARG